MYQRLHMDKEVQFHMWTSFLEQVAKMAGGRLRGGIDAETRIVDDVDQATEKGGSLRDGEVQPP
jgi:hypothetical protein